MDPTLLLKIESLHARSVQETGLKFRQRGREVYTGTIVATLDDSAPFPANVGLINFATGTIQLRWAVVAMLPFMADAFAAGAVAVKESAPLRISFEEYGQVSEDGCGFDVEGTGEISTGSVLSSAEVTFQNNFIRMCPESKKKTFKSLICAGETVRCALAPSRTWMPLCPNPWAAARKDLNLVGGFLLKPVMTLGQLTKPVKGKHKSGERPLTTINRDRLVRVLVGRVLTRLEWKLILQTG